MELLKHLKVDKMRETDGKSAVKAFVDILVTENPDDKKSNALVIRGFRVVEGKKGLFVGMPREKRQDKYYDIAYPITETLRTKITNLILEYYNLNKGKGAKNGGTKK